MVKKILGILLIVLSYSEIFAQTETPAPLDQNPSATEKRRSTYFKVTADSITSATTRNALVMENALQLNRINGQGKDTHYNPTANPTYRGVGFEWGMGIRHGAGFFKSNILVSAAVLGAGEAQNDLNKSGGASFLAENSITNFYYSDNKLTTARIGYYGDILPFHNSSNSFLEKIGIRLGLEAYGNQSELTSDLNNKSGLVPFGSLPGLDFLAKRKLTYTEQTVNGVIGLNYELVFAQKHKLSLGVEHFQSVYGGGNYENKLTGLSSGPFIMPTNSKVHGEVTNKINGNRFSFGYAFSFTESFAIKLSFGISKAIHEVISSDVKDPPNPLSLLMGGGDSSSLLYSLASPMSANPRSVDSRNQFGLAFEFKF
ncbi:hypothetical protein [Leptospira andrefontaineae]|uniref:Porin n=1 Tax=Leptospira andrefontaineae TaxID=2484976 RepID=A0A4R9H5N7_9LEPT|nr:hypothetical protein [Leptospira andrefontaineae]TGK40419.1 hypothetical protein EHO65_09920 [Leptospira andrefontaineae]